MKVDIWSDVRCPFCYIGKHKFEAALEQFAHKDQIAVEWHSFELDPAMETDTTVDANSYLAERKGVSKERAMQMHQHVQQSADSVGLHFAFDKMVMANSFNAHRLIQLSKLKGCANELEEALFKAQFEEGKNIDDIEVLKSIGKTAGLDEQDIDHVLESDAYTNEVRADEAIAQKIGINGVPFFVLDNKYGVSGAQPQEVFLSALQQAWGEQTVQPAETMGDSCDIDGNC